MARHALVPPALTLGPFRASEAVRSGTLTRNQLSAGAWRRLYSDVYVDSTLPVDHRLRCQGAALLLPPGGAIGSLSAAHVWGVKNLDPGPAVSVVIPLAASLRSRADLVVRREHLSAGDITPLFGIPVTTPVRTAFDLTRFLPRVDAVVALDAMLRQSKLSPTALVAYLESMSGYRGVRIAREIYALCDPLAESPMETRMRLVIVFSDLPVPGSQVKIFNGKQFVARVDFAYEERRLAWSTTVTTTGTERRSASTWNDSGSLIASDGGCCGSTPTTSFAFRTECSPRSEQLSTDHENWYTVVVFAARITTTMYQFRDHPMGLQLADGCATTGPASTELPYVTQARTMTYGCPRQASLSGAD